MKKTLIFVGMLAIAYANAQQGNVGINTTNSGATLEIKVAGINSNNDTNQGVLIPKLTKTRVAGIADSKLVKGTLVFVEGSTYTGANAKVVDINADGFYYYNGTKWVKVEGSVLPSGNVNGQILKWNGFAWIVGTDTDTKYTAGAGLTLSGTTFSANPAGIALGGDVTGNANANTVAKIQGRAVANTAPTNGQVLKWNQAEGVWKPENDANTNTTYTAGTGLVLTGTAFSVKYGNEAGTAVQGNDSRVNNGQTAFSWGNHATAGYLKTLPIASATQLGGVKVGANLNITADGVLSATDTNTTYTAGTGLTLTGTTFSANPAGIALGGDVTGNANANTVAKIQGRAVANTAPTNGQVLKWNQAEGVWKPENDANTNTTYAGSTSVVLSGNSFQRAALTGDVSSAQNNNTVTINTGAVTGAKIANGTITADKLAPGVIPTDTNTTYTAGTGLTLTGTTFSANPAGIALGGDVTGNANANTVAKIQGRAVANTAPTNGQVLKWNGTAWAPAADDNTNTTYTAGQAIYISSNKISVKTSIRTVTGATTLAATDDNGYVYVNTSSAVNITIPANLPVGFSCVIVQKGTGQVTIVAGTGVTAETARGTKTRARHSAVGIIKDTASTFTITGDAIN